MPPMKNMGGGGGLISNLMLKSMAVLGDLPIIVHGLGLVIFHDPCHHVSPMYIERVDTLTQFDHALGAGQPTF